MRLVVEVDGAYDEEGARRDAAQEVFGDLEAVVARIAQTARRAGEARLTR